MIYFPGTINIVSTQLYCHDYIHQCRFALHLPAVHINLLCACWHSEAVKGSSSLSTRRLLISLWVTSSLFLCPEPTDAPYPYCEDPAPLSPKWHPHPQGPHTLPSQGPRQFVSASAEKKYIEHCWILYILIYTFDSELFTHCLQEINAGNSFDQCNQFQLIYLPNQSESRVDLLNQLVVAEGSEIVVSKTEELYNLLFRSFESNCMSIAVWISVICKLNPNSKFESALQIRFLFTKNYSAVVTMLCKTHFILGICN